MTRTKLIAMLMISALFAVMVPGEEEHAAPGAGAPVEHEGAREADRSPAPFTWLARSQRLPHQRTPG